MTFKLFIDADGPAFQPAIGTARYGETARLLREIADRIENIAPPTGNWTGHQNLGDYSDNKGGWSGHYQTIFDADGHDVGRYAFKEE